MDVHCDEDGNAPFAESVCEEQVEDAIRKFSPPTTHRISRNDIGIPLMVIGKEFVRGKRLVTLSSVLQCIPLVFRPYMDKIKDPNARITQSDYIDMFRNAAAKMSEATSSTARKISMEVMLKFVCEIFGFTAADLNREKGSRKYYDALRYCCVKGICTIERFRCFHPVGSQVPRAAILALHYQRTHSQPQPQLRVRVQQQKDGNAEQRCKKRRRTANSGSKGKVHASDERSETIVPVNAQKRRGGATARRDVESKKRGGSAAGDGGRKKARRDDVVDDGDDGDAEGVEEEDERENGDGDAEDVEEEEEGDDGNVEDAEEEESDDGNVEEEEEESDDGEDVEEEKEESGDDIEDKALLAVAKRFRSVYDEALFHKCEGGGDAASTLRFFNSILCLHGRAEDSRMHDLDKLIELYQEFVAFLKEKRRNQ